MWKWWLSLLSERCGFSHNVQKYQNKIPGFFWLLPDTQASAGSGRFHTDLLRKPDDSYGRLKRSLGRLLGLNQHRRIVHGGKDLFPERRILRQRFLEVNSLTAVILPPFPGFRQIFFRRPSESLLCVLNTLVILLSADPDQQAYASFSTRLISPFSSPLPNARN